MKKQFLINLIVLMGIVLVPIFASADAVTDTISNITDYIIIISSGLAILMYVVAGFLWMSDAGNIERVKIAKSIIGSTTIGLVVILMAVALVSIVKDLVVTN